MQSKNWMWLFILASFFLITACSQNQVTTESPVGTQATAESLVGTQAPAFQLEDARGGQISLSDFTQQKTPVLLYFHMALG